MSQTLERQHIAQRSETASDGISNDSKLALRRECQRREERDEPIAERSRSERLRGDREYGEAVEEILALRFVVEDSVGYRAVSCS